MWIDFSEQRPREDGKYLVFADSGGFMSEYMISNFIDGEWDSDLLNADIYWTFLPPPPNSIKHDCI